MEPKPLTKAQIVRVLSSLSGALWARAGNQPSDLFNAIAAEGSDEDIGDITPLTASQVVALFAGAIGGGVSTYTDCDLIREVMRGFVDDDEIWNHAKGDVRDTIIKMEEGSGE